MMNERSPLAILIFILFIGATLGLSFWLGRRTKSSQGYFAAHGQIPWFVNGVAFAGDYLSAASFLGICGLIAFYGYDGFLYSIGYLAGWIVALFVVAEPIKRLGRFTFADALDAKFGSRGIQLVAGISTLVVSVFYLIPQMVGAGALIRPLLNYPHYVGVLIVGVTVMVIVVTAGMMSTTYVQFLKGSLLVLFSTILTVIILRQGFVVRDGGVDGYHFRRVGPVPAAAIAAGSGASTAFGGGSIVPADGPWADLPFVRTQRADGSGPTTVWHVEQVAAGQVVLHETQTVTKTADGRTLINGLPMGIGEGQAMLHPVGYITRLPHDVQSTGAVGPFEYLRVLQQSEVTTWGKQKLSLPDHAAMTIYYPQTIPGSRTLRPGEYFKGIRSPKFSDRLDFVSLMLALFCGTASLPHILIRYYTVRDEQSARRSTIVGIAAIGYFYVLTLYMGLGAMTSGALDVTDTNMAAPLLAKSISQLLFAVISGIAFTTVLGTVSGLILAASGAVTRDLIVHFCGIPLSDARQVRVAKITSVGVGAVAIVLGILFQNMNVTYLVGWAFSVAASANLPALIMLLFWKRTTYQGVIASVVVGMVSSLAWILLSADSFTNIYGLPAEQALVPFNQPGIVTIPLSFLVVVLVSWLTQPDSGSR